MYRENKKLTSRLQHAKLRQQACLEDIDYTHARGLMTPQVLELSTSKWVADKHNVLLTGPTGVGKRFRACALGQWRRAPRRCGAGPAPVTSCAFQ